MLAKILNLIKDGTITSVEGLAEELATSPELTKMMLDDLVRKGYLKEYSASANCSCGSSCKGCSGGCSIKNSRGNKEMVFWELTDKGEKK